MDSYNLFIIYSTSDLPTIVSSIYSYTTSKNQIGPIRKDFTRNQRTGKYSESNRNIILIRNSLFEILVKEGLTETNEFDFLITPYDIRKDNYPPEDSVDHLFFPPKNDSVDIIKKKLAYLSKIKCIEMDEWEVKDEGVVFFSESFPIIERIKIKIILDDIEDGFRVSWCKKKLFHRLE